MARVSGVQSARKPAAAARETVKVHRIEVSHRVREDDPRAAAIRRDAERLGVRPEAVRFAQVYLIRAGLDETRRARIAELLLASPILEEWRPGAEPPAPGAQIIEIHPLPGVMDPAAQTVRQSVREIAGVDDVQVTTGRRFDFAGVTGEEAETLAKRLLANPVIHAIHREPFIPDDLPRGIPAKFEIRRIPLRDLEDEALLRLSREAHLFLSLEEMRAIRDEYRTLGREPTDIELETLAQTWSEHCVHKTLKSRIRYRGPKDEQRLDFRGHPGHTIEPDGSVIIDNLLKSTVAAATHELIAEGVDWTLSVFVDNAGVIEFDDHTAVCVKVETHNHPSAIEPYGGAATGVGGCVRDILGTGLGAKPIANTDVFCVAPPDMKEIPAGCLHPRRILTDVVAGVRDYGNRMGIPTLNGAVWFDERHVGNPLVFCGCIGVMPRNKIRGAARPGDRIIAIGGRTGRDGIHGATFSSAELTETHADEFAHAVQIGNAIEEKRVMDAILRARDVEGGPLYHAITDCGAGGFSSAVGEMGGALGAEVHLDRAPLKYEGLTYTEVWISEAQERMVLAAPPERLDALRAICDEESVELSDLGVFGTPDADLILIYRGEEVGRMPMQFLHEGLPQRVREAVWLGGAAPSPSPTVVGEGGVRALSSPPSTPLPHVSDLLFRLLSHPNIASKRWIVRQYDHEVQGATVLKPLVGPDGEGPGDASVILPVPLSRRALAVGCGLATGIGDPAIGGDPYIMALAAIDECVRNLVCVGADPDRIAILDNFCWPSCQKPANLASLVRAAEGCYDGAKAFRTPFISGKDSLNNQFTIEDGRTIEIPPTLLITGVGVVPDRERCVTMDAKRAGNLLYIVGVTTDALGGSHAQRLLGAASPNPELPGVNLDLAPRAACAVAHLIRDGHVAAAHDCSDGGLLTAVAEMLIAAHGGRGPTLGATLEHIDDIPRELTHKRAEPAHRLLALCFAETPSRYVLEIAPEHEDSVKRALADVPHAAIGRIDESGMLTLEAAGMRAPVPDLKAAWLSPLDW